MFLSSLRNLEKPIVRKILIQVLWRLHLWYEVIKTKLYCGCVERLVIFIFLRPWEFKGKIWLTPSAVFKHLRVQIFKIIFLQSVLMTLFRHLRSGGRHIISSFLRGVILLNGSILCIPQRIQDSKTWKILYCSQMFKIFEFARLFHIKGDKRRSSTKNELIL